MTTGMKKIHRNQIILTVSLSVTPTSNHISVQYHCFRNQVRKEFVIQNIESENQKADIFTKGLQGDFFVVMRKLAFSC